MKKNKENWLKRLFPYVFLSESTLNTTIENAIAIAKSDDLDWQDVNKDIASEVFEDISTGSMGGDSVFEQTKKSKSSKKTYKYPLGNKKTENISEATYISLGLDSGVNPENIQSLGKLRLSQDASLFQWINFPIGKSIIESTKRYVIGKGIKIDIPQEDVSKVCKAFWKGNNLELEIKDDFRDYLIDGEIIYTLFVNKDCEDATKEPIVYIRRIPSNQIEQVEYDPNDYKTKLSYKRTYIKDGEVNIKHYLDFAYKNEELQNAGLVYNPDISDSEVEAEADVNRMAMFMNSTTFDERGRPFMECILRWNRILMDFVYDRGRLNHLRTKVFLIETRTSKGGRTLGAGSGISSMPKGGTKLIETADRKFRMVDPQTGASDASEDWRMLIYTIAAGVSMPMHVITMNAENENYASIKKSGHPFIQLTEDFRDTWSEYIRQILRYVIAVAIKEGKLKKSYTLEHNPGETIGEVENIIKIRLQQGVPTIDILKEVDVFKKESVEINAVDVPISITYPELTSEDPKIVAETLEIQLRNQLISYKTAMQQLGLNVESERFTMAQEKAIRDTEMEEFLRKNSNGVDDNTDMPDNNMQDNNNQSNNNQ